jgi:integrase
VFDLCEKIKERGAPATAVHAREIIQQVYRHAMARGLKIENPAENVKASAIATFKPRERALTPGEIRTFFTVLDTVGTLPTLKLALKFILLSMCRKGELLQATWKEVDFEAAAWTVPAERMKARRPHVVYLSQQALDLLVGLKTCAGSSPYLLPGRYETDKPMSEATLNRVIAAVVEKAQKEGHELPHFCVHDLRRTGSTLLHEAGFNTDWIEKCLAHEQRGVRAVYNKAEYAEQRREMLQSWADMVDGWIAGAKVVPLRTGKVA